MAAGDAGKSLSINYLLILVAFVFFFFKDTDVEVLNLLALLGLINKHILWNREKPRRDCRMPGLCS